MTFPNATEHRRSRIAGKIDARAGSPAGGSVDASDVTYTPADDTDWDGDADPGNADDAFDQLAERVDDLEAGGGASGKLPLDIFGSVGSGDDFAGTTLDGGWSSLQTTPITLVDRTVDGFVILKNSGSTTGKHRGIKRAFTPAGDFTVMAKLEWANLLINYVWTGIFAGASDPSDAAGGKRIETFVVYSNQMYWKFDKYASGTETSLFSDTWSNLALSLAPEYPIWLRIRREGSTLYAGISFDGVQFKESATTTTIDFTVETCGLLVAQNNSTIDFRATYDHIVTTG